MLSVYHIICGKHKFNKAILSLCCSCILTFSFSSPLASFIMFDQSLLHHYRSKLFVESLLIKYSASLSSQSRSDSTMTLVFSKPSACSIQCSSQDFAGPINFHISQNIICSYPAHNANFYHERQRKKSFSICLYRLILSNSFNYFIRLVKIYTIIRNTI